MTLFARAAAWLAAPRPPGRNERLLLRAPSKGGRRSVVLERSRATPFSKGWWMAELRIDDPAGAGTARLILDYPDGASRQSLTLPFSGGRTCKRLFFNAVAPEVVLLELPASAWLHSLRFAPVTARFARDRMSRRIRRHTAAYAALSPREVRAVLRRDARARGETLETRLRHLYDLTFSPVVQGPEDAYRQWIRRREPLLFNASGDSVDLEWKPLISVVMPVFDGDPEYLRRAIDSVTAQRYENWELCIADDASTDPRIRPLLEQAVKRDPRIRVVYRGENGHISRATNSALALARGEFVAFLDHDDELSPHALHEVVSALNGKPDLDIIYSDEDFLDPDGHRVNPHFKPDWNPQLLFGHNYVTHLCVYSRALVTRAGGMRPELEGAQDYDLLLRCARLTDATRIHHIPKILYHWRMAAGSTASADGEKPYTVEAGRRALQDYFDQEGRPVTVEPTAIANFYRVTWHYPDPPPLVSIIVPTRDRLDVLRPCVTSVLGRTRYPRFELLIVDNGSRDKATLDYLERLTDDPRVRVLRHPGRFNFSRINNVAVERCEGDMVCLLNNDTEVITPEWLDEMVMLARDPATGCVGAKLYYTDDTVQHAGVILGLGGFAAHSHRGYPRASRGYFNRLMLRQNVSAVTGACLLTRRSIYTGVGGFDEELAVAYNDVDFCLKVRAAGYQNVFTPFAELYHHESKSRGIDDTADKMSRFDREKERLLRKWGDIIRHDPCYNTNLTHSREDFSVDETVPESGDIAARMR